ncbi:MAG: hypothetical protein OXE75_05000 [bacterium]|nr:hypothetical protein [bacterium]
MTSEVVAAPPNRVGSHARRCPSHFLLLKPIRSWSRSISARSRLISANNCDRDGSCAALTD